jgi:hypothetical protein
MRRLGGLFLFLFGLPFAAIGIGAYSAFLWLIYQSIETGSWVKVPANLLSAELSSTSDDGSVTLRAKAKYQYVYNGIDFTSERVALLNLADNFGEFQKQLSEELIKSFESHTPVDCYVNPNNPADAILNRELRYELLAFFSVFALMFGVIGIAISIACFFRDTGSDSVIDAQGYIDSSSPESSPVAIALFIYAVGLLGPLLIFLPREISAGYYGSACFGGVMSVVSFLVAWSCYRVKAQILRFGKSRLQIKQFKLSEEGIFTGSVVTERSGVAGLLPLKVKFRCVEEGIGDDSSITLTTSEQAVTVNTQVGRGLVVPLNIKFKTPSRLINQREVPSKVQFEINIESLKGATKFATKFVISAPLANKLISKF